ncbi:agamous-like MADS-box protein AGL30 isoform X2 [Cornus florida]|uniref:agamous-like MADS-box protein AGL30 isoform X2 n=1 Tax=Cornus florida TaxID=4283 RepID=UPI002897604E|nr:agamous-like MADS-box protein AGL30 isoform X2 [Cornus florida]
MGRVKLKIKRLENINGRQSTYAKRKNGIIKKANELSILCDIDIVLIMFSPSGKPTICKAKNSIEGVITKFAQLTPQERAKRKLESLEALKKTFKKLDHDVNIQDFIGTSYQSVEDLTNRTKLLRNQLSEVQNRLSCWTNLDKIDSIEQLGQMEDSLRQSLNEIRTRKENFGKQPILSLGCTNQFQNGIHLGHEQQIQPLSWIPNDDSQQMVLAKDTGLFPKRDMDCSAGTSYGGYSGYFGNGEKVEIASTGQENGFLDELIKTEALRLQMYAQYPYPPHNFSFLSDKKFEPAQQLNLQENTEDYRFDGNFEPPRQFGFDTTLHNSASISEPCSVPLLDERLYPQQHCTSHNQVANELGYMHVQATHHQPNLTN